MGAAVVPSKRPTWLYRAINYKRTPTQASFTIKTTLHRKIWEKKSHNLSPCAMWSSAGKHTRSRIIIKVFPLYPVLRWSVRPGILQKTAGERWEINTPDVSPQGTCIALFTLGAQRRTALAGEVTWPENAINLCIYGYGWGDQREITTRGVKDSVNRGSG